MVVIEKLEKAEKRFVELELLLADPQVISNPSQYQQLAKEYAGLTPIVGTFKEYKRILDQAQELNKLLTEKHDKDFVELAHAELSDLESKKKDFLDKLDGLLNPKASEKNRDIMIEIRAGTGGEEASLFAGELYRMYVKYAESKGWKVDVMSTAASSEKGSHQRQHGERSVLRRIFRRVVGL